MKITEETNLFLCKYIVRALTVLNGEDQLTFDSSNLLSLEYICDYDQSLFAILKLSLRVDTRKKIYLLRNKRKIRVKLEIDRLGMDMEVELAKTNPEPIFSEVFAVYFNDDDENLDAENLSERLAVNESGNEDGLTDINAENYYESQNALEMYLFNADLLKASRYSSNKVYTETTLQNVIGQLLTESGHRDVLMSRLENFTSYRELLLPANPAYRNLLYLDQYFGLYKAGATVFYDLDVLYILNTAGKVTAKRKDEWTETCFLIPELEQSLPGNGMVRYPDEKIFYPTVSEQNVKHQKVSIMKNISDGSRTKIVLSDGTEIIDLKADQEFIDSQNETVTYVKKENQFTETILRARMEENDGIVLISANNLDIDAFKPNKLFKLVYDDPIKSKLYSGVTYRLAYAYHCIRIESEQFSSCSHHLILKRTTKPT